MAAPSPSQSPTQMILHVLRSHPLLVAWISVLTGLCFATGVAVSVLLDPTASHSLSRNNGSRATAGTAPDATAIAPFTPDIAPSLDPPAAADPVDPPLVPNATPATPSQPAPGSGTVGSDAVLIIAPATGLGRGDSSAASSFTAPNTTTNAPGNAPGNAPNNAPGNTPETEAIAPPAASLPAPALPAPALNAATVSHPSTLTPGNPLRLWLLGGVGFSCALGALWVSQQLMAEFRGSPNPSLVKAGGDRPGETPDAVLPPVGDGTVPSIAALVSSPIVPPISAETQGKPMDPVPKPSVSLSPQPVPPPSTNSLLDEADLRKRRSASSWLDS